MIESAQLEKIATELIATFGITTPPIPIESMLQRPQPGMWEELDISQLTTSFLNITSNSYSPRMSLARMMVRHIVESPWGRERELHTIDSEEVLHKFARMLVMPAEMVLELNPNARTAPTISAHFEVPEADAALRLKELGAA